MCWIHSCEPCIELVLRTVSAYKLEQTKKFTAGFSCINILFWAIFYISVFYGDIFITYLFTFQLISLSYKLKYTSCCGSSSRSRMVTLTYYWNEEDLFILQYFNYFLYFELVFYHMWYIRISCVPFDELKLHKRMVDVWLVFVHDILCGSFKPCQWIVAN